MTLGRNKRAVGVFSNRSDTELALRELRDSHFPMNKVSVITRDTDPEGNIAGANVRDRVGNKADEGATAGAIAGGTLGGLTGLLVGLGTLAIPGIGPIMLAGATATAIATTLAGGAIGAATGSLIGALIGLGIPEERARVYNERVSRGHYLVLVDGTDDDIHRAQAILSHQGIEEWGVYDSPSDGRELAHRPRRAVGVFPQRRNAEAALDDLRDSGFPMNQVSLVARDYDRHNRIPGLTVRDRYDNTFFGFPQERNHFFHDRFNRGEYLVVVDGTDDEIRRAEPILNRYGIQDWGMFEAPEHDHTRTGSATPATPHRALARRRAVGVFPNRRNLEAALYELRDTGFPVEHISVVGKHADKGDRIAGIEMSNRATGNKADEGAAAGAATGGILGGLGGLLVGLGALAIPGIGPVIAGGALGTALATTAAGGAIGAAAGGLTGALVGLGIPEERAKYYNDRVARGDYLVMVDGTDDEVHRAQAIFSRHGVQDWGIYDASDVASGHTRHDTPDVDRSRMSYVTPSTGKASPAPTPRSALVHNKRAVGVFPHVRDVEVALDDLRDAGLPMHQVSVIARDYDHRNRIPGLTVRDRFDNTVFAFPQERSRLFHDRFNRGEYLVMVDGTDDEIRRAEPILNRRGIQEFGIYDPSQATATRQVIEPTTTPGVDPTHGNYQVVSDEPDVIIIDRRDQSL